MQCIISNLSGMFTIDFKREFRRCCCLINEKNLYQEVQTHSVFTRSDVYRANGRHTHSYLRCPGGSNGNSRNAVTSHTSASSPREAERGRNASGNGVNNIYKTRIHLPNLNELKKPEHSSRLKQSSIL